MFFNIHPHIRRLLARGETKSNQTSISAQTTTGACCTNTKGKRMQVELCETRAFILLLVTISLKNLNY